MNTTKTTSSKAVRLTANTSVNPSDVEKLSELELLGGRKGTSIHIKGSKKAITVDLPLADVTKALDWKAPDPEEKVKAKAPEAKAPEAKW